MLRLRHRLIAATESFWFIPGLLLVGAIGLSELMIALDRTIGAAPAIAQLPFVSSIGASGSRDLLSAIGGSMLGVAATSFSITISVIATASSTYGPRLVRNFMANRGNQTVLGTFGATFLYALLVLRTVRTEGDKQGGFVPHLAVTLAIGLAVVNVAVLIYFIHHIADSIQVSTLAQQVLDELQQSVKGGGPQPDTEVSAHAPNDPPPGHDVCAENAGYLQVVDRGSLISLAEEHDARIQLMLAVGDHVHEGDLLAQVWLDHPVEKAGTREQDGSEEGSDEDRVDKLQKAIRRQMEIDSIRTPRQDVRYAAQQLVEMAVRALSPSTNDPYTAINAITELGVGLAPLVRRPPRPNAYTRDGRLRLVEISVPASEVVELVFNQLRPHAATSTEVVLSVLGLADRFRGLSADPATTACLDRQVEALLREFRAEDPDPYDLQRVAECRERARQQAMDPGGQAPVVQG